MEKKEVVPNAWYVHAERVGGGLIKGVRVFSTYEQALREPGRDGQIIVKVMARCNATMRVWVGNKWAATMEN